MTGVTIDGYHCYDDFKMILASREIGLPEIQTTTIEIPGLDGNLDLTDVLLQEDSKAYPPLKDRELKLTFITTVNMSGVVWSEFLSDIADKLHGKKVSVIFDEDPNYYYYGRCSINNFETNCYRNKVVLNFNCEPYKYAIEETRYELLLDSEDTETLELSNNRMVVIPTIRARWQWNLVSGTSSSATAITLSSDYTIVDTLVLSELNLLEGDVLGISLTITNPSTSTQTCRFGVQFEDSNGDETSSIYDDTYIAPGKSSYVNLSIEMEESLLESTYMAVVIYNQTQTATASIQYTALMVNYGDPEEWTSTLEEAGAEDTALITFDSTAFAISDGTYTAPALMLVSFAEENLTVENNGEVGLLFDISYREGRI